MSEPILWCKKHKASATGQTERCLSVLNAALRMGVNPFDSYNSHRLGGKCELVAAMVVEGSAVHDAD